MTDTATDVAKIAREAAIAATTEVLSRLQAGYALEQRVWLSSQEAARYLGLNEATLAVYVKAGCAPESFKIGGGRRFNRADLDRWIRAGGITAFPGVNLRPYDKTSNQ